MRHYARIERALATLDLATAELRDGGSTKTALNWIRLAAADIEHVGAALRGEDDPMVSEETTQGRKVRRLAALDSQYRLELNSVREREPVEPTKKVRPAPPPSRRETKLAALRAKVEALEAKVGTK